jgi:hypothetical protein
MHYLDTYSCEFLQKNMIVCGLYENAKSPKDTIMIGFVLLKEKEFPFFFV